MIQRIQTIFLLLAGGALGGLFALPFATNSAPTPEGLFMDGAFNIYDNPVLIGLCVLGILVALLGIFMYRNRGLQQRLGYLGIALCILIPLVAFLFFTGQADTMAANDTVEDAAGIYLPFSGIILFGLAIYFVRKDDKLVKSMDRLR